MVRTTISKVISRQIPSKDSLNKWCLLVKLFLILGNWLTGPRLDFRNCITETRKDKFKVSYQRDSNFAHWQTGAKDKGIYLVVKGLASLTVSYNRFIRLDSFIKVEYILDLRCWIGLI